MKNQRELVHIQKSLQYLMTFMALYVGGINENQQIFSSITIK